MAKAKQPQQQKKKKGGKKKKAPRVMSMGPVAKMVCSISNPFCPEAEGAKVPDSNTSKSITYCSRQVIPLVADAAGALALFVTPRAANSYRTASAITSSVVTTWGGWNTNTFYSALSTACSQYRVVSWGLKFKSTEAFTAAKGMCVLTEVPGDATAATGQNITSLNVGPTSDFFPLKDSDFFFVGKPTGMTSNEYVSMSTTSALAWTNCLLMISGANANPATLGYLELIINYEWLPVDNTGYASVTTSAAPDVPQLMQARSHVFSDVSVMGKTPSNFDDGWMRKAASVVGSGIGGAVRGFFAAGPAGAARGGVSGLLTNGPRRPMIMDVD